MTNRPSPTEAPAEPSMAASPTDPEMRPSTGGRRNGRAWWIVGLAIAALVVLVGAPLASGDPDGLERVAEELGFIDRAEDAPVEVLPDYTVPGFDNGLSTVAAGLIGVAIVAGVMVLLGRLLARRRVDVPPAASPRAGPPGGPPHRPAEEPR